MIKSIIHEANKKFLEKDYLKSKELYLLAAHKYQTSAFDFNIKLCDRKLCSALVLNTDEIYYCIPVMNRLDDLKATLCNNIDVVSRFKDVFIYINIFDGNSDTLNWVNSSFQQYINKLLFVNKERILPYWHFSWAKNSFAKYLNNGWYSSLDGDNFITEEDIRITKDIISSYPFSIIHHFSGVWGDGTSGRVIVPVSVYKKHGYRNDIYPRQFDEMSLILNIMKKEENFVYISNNDGCIFKKSEFIKNFCKLNNWNPKIQFEKIDCAKKPINPKCENYVKNDGLLSFYTNINASYSLLNLCNNSSSKEHYSSMISKFKSSVFFKDFAREVSKKTLSFQGLGDEPSKSSELTVYAVLKDEDFFIDTWIAHYKSLGVKRFFLIDDNSKIPICLKDLGENVYIFKPVFGDFKNFKSYWVQCLMSLYQEYNSWCFTVDCDEFIDFPLHFEYKNNSKIDFF